MLADRIIPSSLFPTLDGNPVTNFTDQLVESLLFYIGPLPAGNVLQFFVLEASTLAVRNCPHT